MPPAWPSSRVARAIARATLRGLVGRTLLDGLTAVGARLLDLPFGRLSGVAFSVRDIAYAHGRAALGRGEVIVLALHAVADLRDDPLLAAYAIPPAEFDAIVDALGRTHTFVGLDEVVAGLAGLAPLPRRGVLLTFDDGYADLADVVGPRLHDWGIPAVAFVVTECLGTTNTWDEARGGASLPLMDAAGLQRLTPMPLAVGAHSRSHPNLTHLCDDDLRAEVAGARADLQRAGLPAPVAFCFPYGQFDDRTIAATRAAGYGAAFTLEPGVVRPGADPLRLPRIELHRGDTGLRLRAKLAAGRRGRLLPRRLAWLLRMR